MRGTNSQNVMYKKRKPGKSVVSQRVNSPGEALTMQLQKFEEEKNKLIKAYEKQIYYVVSKEAELFFPSNTINQIVLGYFSDLQGQLIFAIKDLVLSKKDVAVVKHDFIQEMNCDPLLEDLMNSLKSHLQLKNSYEHIIKRSENL